MTWKSIIDTFLSWVRLRDKIQNPGLILDPPEVLEGLPKHELFVAGGDAQDWGKFCPPFRYQGSSTWCTAYAGTSIGSIMEKVERGGSLLFSPPELFYRTGGFLGGNYLVSAARGMMESLVLENDVPTPILTSWGTAVFSEWQKKSVASKTALDFGRQFRMKSFASVKTDSASLRSALSSSPLMIAVGIGRGYFDDPAPRQSQYSAYHAVVLTSMDADGTYTIFDSLTQRQGFDGFHRLAPNYEILSALSFIDLPEGWKEVQEQETQAVHADALSHYGEKRDLLEEQRKAKFFADILKKHPTVQSLAGREWTVCVNALAYGGYSYTDLLNHFTNIRRTGKPIWDLNKKRNSQ